MKNPKGRKYGGWSLVLILLLVAMAGCSSPGASDGYESFDGEVSPEGLLATIEQLASEEFQGRMTGSAGNEAAMAYVVERLTAFGMAPAYGDGDYVQEYTQKVMVPYEGMTLAIVDGDGQELTRFIPYEHYREALHYTHVDGDVELTAEAVIITDYDQLAEGKAQDKIAVIHDSVIASGDLEQIFRTAYFNGAKAVFFNRAGKYNEIYYVKSASIMQAVYENEFEDETGIPSLYVDDAAMGVIETGIQQGRRFHLDLNFEIREVETGNIVSVIPGNPGDETILIGAHLDHVGNYSLDYCPGALDNASGVAAILQIAQILGDDQLAPEKNIVLMTFNGEETGLIGSYVHTLDPLFDLDSTAMINLDMVGSKRDVPLSIERVGSNTGSLAVDLKALAQDAGLSIDSGQNGRSDHINFANAGSEAVLLINYDHSDIHTPLDTPERDIDPEYLARVVDLLLRYLDENAF